MKWLIPVLLALPAGAEEIAVPDLVDVLSARPSFDVVILGEIHDNPSHHAHQAMALAALQPKAVVWEMLRPDAEVPEDRSDAARLAASLGWSEAGWPDFSLYHPIFLAAGTARHYGAEVPRDEARAAMAEGALAAVDDAARFGLDKDLPEAEQALREAEQQTAHCDALPPSLLPGMVAAQRLRDASLARAVLQALSDTGPPVAVITGSGHARRDWGLPAVLQISAPELSVLSVGQFESDPGPDAPFDLWLISDPVDRPDPCAAFR